MFYKLVYTVFLFVCFRCFSAADDSTPKNILKTDNSETLNWKINSNSDVLTTEVEKNWNLYAAGTCNETLTCQNGGSCLQHVCVCLQGTYGPFCENVYDCLHTDMCKLDDSTDCSYDKERQKAYCTCRTMEYRFDEATKTCRSCLCTPWDRQYLGSFSYCDYQQGQQVCVCTEGYSYNPKYKICAYCDCNPNSTWCGFDKDGNQMCGCEEGYFSDGYRCTKCLCGSHGICDPNVVYPSCACDEGYATNKGVCVECSCGKYGTCLYDEHSKQVGCKCDTGYAEKSGKCEMCYCGDNVNCSFSGERKVCGCEPGYEDANGFCEDINECEKHSPCKDSMICVNLLGSYTCICKEGYEPVIIDTVVRPVRPIVICQDIDECQNSSVCAQPNTFCENTIGSFKCMCKSGFISRGILGSSSLCEKSTATSIYTFNAIASFVSLLLTGTIVYYTKKTFQRNHPGYHQELK